jgi:hypothetical protein
MSSNRSRSLQNMGLDYTLPAWAIDYIVIELTCLAAVSLFCCQTNLYGVKTYHHRSEMTHNNHKKLIRIASSTEHASSKSSQNTKK